MKKAAGLFIVLLLVFFGATIYQQKPSDSKYSIDENLIKQISTNVPNYTIISKMPDNLKNAVISIEDKRFYKHPGFDVASISRALYANIKARKIIQGGSTITQQLAKNLFLTNDRSFKRKVNELVYTLKIERKYTKDEILEMYLNVIYYGSNVYGAPSASRKYFNKDIENLSLAECAMLAGIPQSPNLYNPLKHPDKAKKRQEIVLNSMSENGFLNKKSKEMAENQLLFIAQ